MAKQLVSEWVSVEVRGTPRPQGALQIGSGGHNGKKFHLYNRSGAPLADWRHAVASEARARAPKAPWSGPVVVALTFKLQKPKSAPKSRRVYPAKPPDIDKLVRAVLDALTGVVFEDDKQVLQLWAEKDYGVPGVRISVGRISE